MIDRKVPTASPGWVTRGRFSMWFRLTIGAEWPDAGSRRVIAIKTPHGLACVLEQEDSEGM